MCEHVDIKQLKDMTLASAALVGSWKTVAESTLDYVDLGCGLISTRVFDNLKNMVDYVLPLVREGIREIERKAHGAQASKNADRDAGARQSYIDKVI